MGADEVARDARESSEHLIDWFHITMRLTVLQQQTKALQEERPETGATDKRDRGRAESRDGSK
jgi:hypothetical protein